MRTCPVSARRHFRTAIVEQGDNFAVQSLARINNFLCDMPVFDHRSGKGSLQQILQRKGPGVWP